MSETKPNNEANNQTNNQVNNENAPLASYGETIPEINPLEPKLSKAKTKENATPKKASLVERSIIILLILLFSGLLGSFYYVFTLHNKIQNEIALLKSAMLKQDEQSKMSLEAYQNKIAQEYKNIENQIENQALQLQQLSDKHNWRLSEVIYLVSIAQERLDMGQENTTAIKMLKTADERLKHFSDVRVGPIRASIIKDIANLETSVQLDKMGIWIELGALRQQLHS